MELLDDALIPKVQVEEHWDYDRIFDVAIGYMLKDYDDIILYGCAASGYMV